MKVKLNETGKQNVITLTYNDIITLAGNIYSRRFKGWSGEDFKADLSLSFKNGEYSDEDMVIELRSLVDDLMLLRNVSKNIDGYINTLLIEYATRRGYTSFKMGNYIVQWFHKEKSRQNLVDLLHKNKFVLSETTWSDINVSADKLYSALSEKGFPEDVVKELLFEEGLMYNEEVDTYDFIYNQKIDGIDYNLNMTFVYTDLRKELIRIDGDFLQGLIKLQSYLSDIEVVYKYAHDKLGRTSKEFLVDCCFEYGKYIAVKDDKEVILPVNSDGMSIYQVLVDNNILLPADLIPILWSRKNLHNENSIKYYEDAIEVYKAPVE